jgi:hypothetical protein
VQFGEKNYETKFIFCYAWHEVYRWECQIFWKKSMMKKIRLSIHFFKVAYWCISKTNCTYSMEQSPSWEAKMS